MTFRSFVIAGVFVATAGALSACVYEPAPAYSYYPPPGPAYYYSPGPAYYAPPAYGSVGVFFGGEGRGRHWR